MVFESLEHAQPVAPDNCPHCGQRTVKNRPFCVHCKFDLHYGKASTHKRGRCMYCGKLGRLTKEQVIGDWVAKAFPKPDVTSRLYRIERPVRLGEMGSPHPIQPGHREMHTTRKFAPFAEHATERDSAASTLALKLPSRHWPHAFGRMTSTARAMPLPSGQLWSI